MRKVKADLHNHLRTSSRMKRGDFDRAVRVAARRLGCGGILGVVNFEDDRYERLLDFGGKYDRQDFGNAVYVPEKEVLIIRGQEVPTRQGHLLVLGLGRGVNLESWQSLGDTLGEARDNDGIVIADHPFYNCGIGPYLRGHPEFINELDGFEIHNGEAALWIPGVTKRNANENARDFYQEVRRQHLCLGAVSSSDGHSFYEIGRSFTNLQMGKHYGHIRDAEELNRELRGAIRDRRIINGKRASARFGAFDHLVDLAVIVGLGKVGIKL